jgi:hypothetical protein
MINTVVGAYPIAEYARPQTASDCGLAGVICAADRIMMTRAMSMRIARAWSLAELMVLSVGRRSQVWRSSRTVSCHSARAGWPGVRQISSTRTSRRRSGRGANWYTRQQRRYDPWPRRDFQPAIMESNSLAGIGRA